MKLFKFLKLFLLGIAFMACQDDLGVQKSTDLNLPASGNADGSASVAAVQAITTPYWMFFRHYDTDLVKYAYSSNGTNWAGNQSLSTFKTSASPTAVFFNNKLFVFFKGRSTAVIYVTSSANGTSWSSAAVIPTIETTRSPTAVVFGGRIYVFASGQSSNRLWYVHSTDGATWSTPTLADNAGSSDIAYINGEPSAYVGTDGHLNIYWTENTNFLVQTKASGQVVNGGISWTPSSYLPVGCTTIAATNRGFNGARLGSTDYLLMKGNDSNNISQYTAGSNACGQLLITSGATPQRPASVSYNGKITTAFIGTSNSNVYTISSTDAVNWTSPVSVSGVSTLSGPALVIAQ